MGNLHAINDAYEGSRIPKEHVLYVAQSNNPIMVFHEVNFSLQNPYLIYDFLNHMQYLQDILCRYIDIRYCFKE